MTLKIREICGNSWLKCSYTKSFNKFGKKFLRCVGATLVVAQNRAATRAAPTIIRGEHSALNSYTKFKEREMRDKAINVTVTDDTLTVDLEDGRTISTPIVWYPRLAHATPAERTDFQISGAGYGIHWSQLDEDIGGRRFTVGEKIYGEYRIIQSLVETASTKIVASRR